MIVLDTLEALETWRAKCGGQKLALVPTMGALHEGHLKLVEEGMKQTDVCLPYIFLNPAQFAAGEDLDKYPKTLEADLEKLEKLGVPAVWTPSKEDIYPNGIEITVKAGSLAKNLEGEHRPHFFDGVTTVLHKMFTLSKPDMVMMGEKDFQQLHVVRQMVHECDMNIDIIGVETVRDNNGLALSSRNQYLSKDEYNIAIGLNKILSQVALNKISVDEAKNILLKKGFRKIDYLNKINSEDFRESGKLDRVLIAAWLGDTRLIDNMPISV